MKILITGATGFVGTPLAKSLRIQGHEVFEYSWNLEKNRAAPINHKNIDAVINLAGENIATGKWTKAKKDRIYTSRVNGTYLLINNLIRQDITPGIWINASAVGYYGDTGDKLNTEDSPSGADFLAKVCKDWELAAFSMHSPKTRVVALRFGVILGKSGGMLAKILPIFKAGLGGPLGNGDQFLSWIALEDVISVIEFTLNNQELHGAFNATSPDVVTNARFTKSLGKALNKPAILPVPAFALKLVYGEMAEALLLSSIRTCPEKLVNAGYKFKNRNLNEFLLNELKKSTHT